MKKTKAIFLLTIFFITTCATAKAAFPRNDDPAWKAIRNQKIDLSEPLSLTQLIDIALKNNPATRQAWENTLVAKAVKKQAQGAFFPKASVSADVTREKEIASISANNVDDLHYGPSFKITYLLFNFGGRAASVEETSQRLVSANYQYNQSIQDLVLNVEKAYYELHTSRENLSAAKDDAENSKIDYEAMREKYDVGLAAENDVLGAKSNYDTSLYNLENAKGAVKSAKANLAQVIGLPADADIEIVTPAGDIPIVTELDITQLIEETIKTKPDLVSQRAELKAKKAAVWSARADLLPTLNAGGSGGISQYHYYGDKRFKENDREYAAYLSVDWDVFDGLANFYKMQQAEKEADAQYEQLVQAEIAASVDVWSKYYDYNTALKKYDSSKAFYDSVNSSYILTSESYKVGLKSVLDLIQSQSKLSDAKSKYTASKKGVFVALAELARAAGLLDSKIFEAKTSFNIKGDKTND